MAFEVDNILNKRSITASIAFLMHIIFILGFNLQDSLYISWDGSKGNQLIWFLTLIERRDLDHASTLFFTITLPFELYMS